ncbi:Aspartate/glutamate/uridylate kinase, partial [Crucibulum laeve]
YNNTVDLIQLEYSNLARSSVSSRHILQELQIEIHEDCDWLRRFLFTSQSLDGTSSKSENAIVATGEKISSKILVAVLLDQGISAEFISIEEIESRIDSDDENQFIRSFSAAIADRIKECGSRIPVVTGFFGHNDGAHSLEVGFAEFLSATLAVGLNASELQVWKTTDGIFTADPAKIRSARLIENISRMEAAELAHHGHPVVSTFTLEQVSKRDIPIRLKNVNDPLGDGTIIQPDLTYLNQNNDYGPWWVKEAPSTPSIDRLHWRRPTTIVINESILMISLSSFGAVPSSAFLADVFDTLHAYGIPLDFVTTNHNHIGLAFEDRFAEGEIERLADELSRLGKIVVQFRMAILTLVGDQMRSSSGVSGHFFSMLVQGGVHVEMIGSASDISMSCVIHEGDTTKALRLIHQTTFRKLDVKKVSVNIDVILFTIRTALIMPIQKI